VRVVGEPELVGDALPDRGGGAASSSMSLRRAVSTVARSARTSPSQTAQSRTWAATLGDGLARARAA
jgi:hypothetical protein